jgi:hypothetical protein
MNVKEIGNLTNFSSGTIYSWFKDELLPFSRGVKQEYLVRRKDLNKFLRKYYGIDLYDEDSV